MNLTTKIEALSARDTGFAYQNLKELEELSEESALLYPYFEDFLEMMRSDQYVIRVRGYRLLAKQARWDQEKKIDANLTEILVNLTDEKSTAVRQKLVSLAEIAEFKPALSERIRAAVQRLSVADYPETMRPLIKKDIDLVREKLK